MNPAQVTIRFPAEAGRTWRFRPVGAVPRLGIIRPRPWDVTPDAAEAADGSFEVALLATDKTWAWQVRDPDNHKRTVAIAQQSATVDYAHLPDTETADPSVLLELATPAPAPASPTETLQQTPLWLLDVVRDLARRQAEIESRVGVPAGMQPIGTTDEAIDTYIAGFINPLIGDYL